MVPRMRVHLCGVRGSTPSPGREFVDVGGHTSCVAVAHDGQPPQLALDGGTGLRRLSEVLDGSPFRGTLILTHLHWDHIIGLPFFTAGDRPDARVRVLVPEQGLDPRDAIGRAMGPPLFPIGPDQLRGDWTFETYDEASFDVDGFTVTARQIPHSAGRTMGLRVVDRTGSLAYLPDHAPQTEGPGEHGLGELHAAAMALADGVDLLLHDSQYTRAEIATKFTWGHAAADYTAHLAEAAGVGRALLFHHDPGRTDDQVRALRDDVVAKTGIEVGIACEGDTIDLPG
jgi:phosphoribosyl 1,2-cyclic phosphodiesterase